jgi:hypothetical protein
MKRPVLIIVAVFLLFLLAGCGDMQKMIENATEREITVYNTVVNSPNSDGVKAVLVAKNLDAPLGEPRDAGVTSISDMSERIDVARQGLGDVRFYVKGEHTNRGNISTRVRWYVRPGASQDNAPTAVVGPKVF